MLRINSLVAEYVVLMVARSYITISYMLINQQIAVIVMERKRKQQNHQPASSNSEGKQKTHYSRNRQYMLPSNKKIS